MKFLLFINLLEYLITVSKIWFLDATSMNISIVFRRKCKGNRQWEDPAEWRTLRRPQSQFWTFSGNGREQKAFCAICIRSKPTLNPRWDWLGSFKERILHVLRTWLCIVALHAGLQLRASRLQQLYWDMIHLTRFILFPAPWERCMYQDSKNNFCDIPEEWVKSAFEVPTLIDFIKKWNRVVQNSTRKRRGKFSK